jgi:hypothetical protein
MKTTNPILMVMLAIGLALTGCKKKAAASSSNTPMGCLIKMQNALYPATPETQASMEKVAFGIRYRQYENALPELDKMAANPALNDAQKKTVNDTIESIKKAMAAPPPAPK